MCSICCDEFPSAEGAFCPDGHFLHRGCLDMQCNQSLERDPVAVTESEKEQRCYAVCCADMSSGCTKAFTTKALANGLSNERFEALGAKNVALGVHLILPDAVKEHLAAAAASGQAATREQHEKCIRDAYRRPDGTFRTERGELVRQCGACSFGPIIAQVNCGDMRAHDGEVRGRHVQNNRCLHCGHLNQGHYESWPRWDGVHVLGAVPSLVHGGEPDAADRPAAPAGTAPDPVIRGPGGGAIPIRGLYRGLGAAPPLRRVPPVAAGPALAVGDLVRVRGAVARPTYGWGAVSHATVGTLTRIYGERNERCDINFPRSGQSHLSHHIVHLWMGQMDEMERANGEQPAAAAVPPPRPVVLPVAGPLPVPLRRSHAIVGLAVPPDEDADGWEPAVARPPVRRRATPDGSRRPRVGDRVRVRADVRTPTYQWGGSISHASVGVIERIYGERDERCDVRFPERASSWLGLLDEMELVGYTTPPPAARAAISDPTAPPPHAARRAQDAMDDGSALRSAQCLQKCTDMGFPMNEALLAAIARTASVHNMESRIAQMMELPGIVEAS